MLIFLLGFMGSGKTHCGKEIAQHFHMPFIDLDQEIERRTGKSISSIFAEEGETNFRKIESETLWNLIQHVGDPETSGGAVISCGGGTPCFHKNMDIMNQHGLTVWLNPSTQVLLTRLKHEQTKRPLIAGLSEEALETFILNKTQEREVYYRQAAIIAQGADCPIDLIENNIKHV